MPIDEAEDGTGPALSVGKGIVEDSNGQVEIDTGFFITVSGPFQPADLNFYCKMACWSATELACVTLGYDPAPLLEADLHSLQSETSLFEAIAKRADLAGRVCRMKYVGQNITPIDGLNWLDSIDEHYPKIMRDLVARYEGNIVPVEAGKTVQTLAQLSGRVERLENIPSADNVAAIGKSSAQIITSLEKMVLGMAVEKFSHDPDSKRNSSTRAIATATELIDASVCEDTVRERLKVASRKHWKGPFD